MYDIITAGGGAAGLAASIEAAKTHYKKTGKHLSIVILERKKTPGRKIKASGNGRCNLSNINAEGYKEYTEPFFRELGVLTRVDEEGRLYPYSESSADVAGPLIREAQRLKIRIETGIDITDIAKTENGYFQVTAAAGAGKKKRRLQFKGRKLLMALGGKSAPELGTKGDGYIFARRLNHTVEKTVPVLTAVETAQKPGDAGYSGVRHKAEVSLVYKEKEIFREKGEILFTDYGVSGIVIFNLSRYLLIPEGKGFRDGFDDYSIKIDLVPELSVERLRAFLTEKWAGGESQGTGFCEDVKELLSSIVREELAEEIGKRVREAVAGSKVPKDKRETLKEVQEAAAEMQEAAEAAAEMQEAAEAAAEVLKCFVMKPEGAKGWNFAQVTKGGVSCEEIDMATMESLKIKNLYFAGEIIDYDGPCGGFNLNNAWVTGIKAGRAMAQE